MKKTFCFTVDDNIRFLKELTDINYTSMFDHPYLSMYKRLHEKYSVKVQLNLFYEYEDFDLSMMTERYKSEWRDCSDWLKLSFHSKLENERPYINSGYDEVYGDCNNVNREILRFAGPASLADTTTLHYCVATEEGIKALSDNGVKGLLGLFGSTADPRTSYGIDDANAEKLRNGSTLFLGTMYYAAIDIILNRFTREDNLRRLNYLKERDLVHIMIHEQYFYPDYKNYQSDFEYKLSDAFMFLKENGFESILFEEEIG